MSAAKLFSILDRVQTAEVLNDGFKNSIIDAVASYAQAPSSNINDTYALLSFLQKVCDESTKLLKEQLISHINATGDRQTSYGQSILFRNTNKWNFNDNADALRHYKTVQNAEATYKATTDIIKKQCEEALKQNLPTPVPLQSVTVAVVISPIKD